MYLLSKTQLNFFRSKKLWIFLLLITLIFFSIGSRLYIRTGLSGDETHYRVMTDSIRNDEDLNLKNDYVQQKYQYFYKEKLDPHINWSLVNISNDKWYSIHGPGLPLLILPGILINDRLGYIPIMLGFGLLAVLGGVFLSTFVASRKSAVLAGIMLTLSIPFVGLSGRLFPDIVIGALLVSSFILISIRKESIWREFLIGLLAAVLIWVHVKTTLIAGSLILIEIMAITSRPLSKTDRHRNLFALLMPFIILLIIFQTKLYHWFGVLTPNGIYKGNTQLFQLSPINSLSAILFDPSRGLMVTSPIWFSAVIGFPEWYRRNKKQLLLVLLLVIPSIMIQSTFEDWSGGWSPPARYTMQYLPILLPAVALGLEIMFRNTKMRFIAISLILIQVIITTSYIFFRTPWSYTGQSSPLIAALNQKFDIIEVPTVFFDSSANPNINGVIVIVISMVFGLLLIIWRQTETKSFWSRKQKKSRARNLR